jgi:hypothetical protein
MRFAPRFLRPTREAQLAESEQRETVPVSWALQQRLVVGTAAVSAFFAGALACLAACYGLLLAFTSTAPRRAEVNEAFAELPAFLCVVALSVPLAVGAGFASALWASARAGRYWSRAPRTES